jgi:hypothetical protein
MTVSLISDQIALGMDAQGKLGKDAGSVACSARVLADQSIASDR